MNRQTQDESKKNKSTLDNSEQNTSKDSPQNPENAVWYQLLEVMNGLHSTFKRATKKRQLATLRFELIAYPSLVVFVLLSVYNFYLTYSLSRDIHNMNLTITTLTISVDRNMTDLIKILRSYNKNSNEMTPGNKDLKNQATDS